MKSRNARSLATYRQRFYPFFDSPVERPTLFFPFFPIFFLFATRLRTATDGKAGKTRGSGWENANE